MVQHRICYASSSCCPSYHNIALSCEQDCLDRLFHCNTLIVQSKSKSTLQLNKNKQEIRLRTLKYVNFAYWTWRGMWMKAWKFFKPAPLPMLRDTVCLASKSWWWRMNGALDLCLVFVFSTTQVKSRSGEVAASQKLDTLPQAWA